MGLIKWIKLAWDSVLELEQKLTSLRACCADDKEFKKLKKAAKKISEQTTWSYKEAIEILILNKVNPDWLDGEVNRLDRELKIWERRRQ